MTTMRHMVATDWGEGFFTSGEKATEFMLTLVRSGTYKGFIEHRSVMPKSGMLFTATIARGPKDYEKD